jgi:hypothetical protein
MMRSVAVVGAAVSGEGKGPVLAGGDDRRLAAGADGGAGAVGGGAVVSRDDGESGLGGSSRTALVLGLAPSPGSSGALVMRTKKALAAKIAPPRTTTSPSRFTPEILLPGLGAIP